MMENSGSVSKEDCCLWTVYIPYQILVQASNNVYGKINRGGKRIYVLGLLAPKGSDNNSYELIGEWFSEPSIKSVTQKSNTDLWLAINKCNTGQIDCKIWTGRQSWNVNCILYDPHLLLESYFLHSSVVLEENDIMMPLVAHSQSICSSLRDTESKTPWIRQICSRIYISSILLSCITFIYSVLTVTIDNRYTQRGLLKNIAEIPSINQHLINRKKLLKTTTMNKSELFRSQNIATMILLDMMLGLLVMVFLMQSGYIDYFSSQFFVWTEKVADELDILLNWLMGAPAGLKLNKPLTEFLGHFFMYHIYLWKGYLHILKPVFSTVLWCSSCIGVLGVSAQISVLQDIVSITTLHIYCYYVYAARLYRLQVYVLSSLWRLFRGKKWNVLRHRVDSASFDVDQLFVGTLLFTIFLFLLPTTALYYTVFTMLRMVVLIFQGCFSTLVYIMNHVPLYSILLWIIGSSKVYGEISLDLVKPDVSSKCLVYSLQMHKVSFGDLLKLSASNIDSHSQSKLSWKHFLLNLLKGHLVYPWIDLNK